MASGRRADKMTKNKYSEICKKTLHIWECKLCGLSMRVPKQLPCLHSFCERCLTSYFTNMAENDKSKSYISCPMCGVVFSEMKDSNCARKFVDNLAIDSVVSAVLSDVAADSSVCSFVDGCQNQASIWCPYCAVPLCAEHKELHSKLASKINHNTLQFENRQKATFPSELCKFHPEEKIEFYCLEDLTLCCKLCKNSQHRSCDRIGLGVKCLHSAAKYLKDNIFEHNLRTSLEDTEKELKMLSNETENQLDYIQKQRVRCKKDICQLRMSIGIQIDGVNNKMISELDTNFNHKIKICNDTGTKMNTFLRTIQYYKQLMKVISERSSDIQAVSELAQVKERIDSLEGIMKNHKKADNFLDLNIRTMKEPARCIPRMGYIRKREFNVYTDKKIQRTQSARF